MTKTELLADLQAKCVWVGDMERMANSSLYPLPESWTVPVIEIGPGGTYQNMRAFRFTVLDEGQPTESVLIHQQVLTPVADTFTAVAYLEAQKAAGTWAHYVEDDAGPKRPDLGFFTIKAWVAVSGGLTEKRFMVSRDSNGDPVHTEIV